MGGTAHPIPAAVSGVSALPGRPTFAASDGVVLAVVALVGAAWLTASSGHFSSGALLALMAALTTWWVAGAMLSDLPALREVIPWTLPAKLLIGFAAVNTTLFLLVWVTPFHVGGNFALAAAATAGAAVIRRPRLVRGSWDSAPGAVAVLVALLGATLWTRDTLHPVELEGTVALVKPWADGFFHAIQIRMFGEAHGASTIQDPSMAGVPARIYHYASYLTAALVRNAGGLSGYETFAGLYVPLGVFMTGLGAAALVGAWWGGWAGVGGVAGLLLLPDGFQQGGGNPFLGYHWMQQVGPAGAYGLALLALAWALLGASCRQARWGGLIAAWILGGVSVVYKAHFFVASALLLWAAPPLLFAGISRRWRTAWLAGALALFAGAIVVWRAIPSLPWIWLDGSSTEQFLALVFQWAVPGNVTDLFAGRLGPARSWAGNVFWGGAYLLVAVLGFWPLAWAALAVALRREVDRLTLLLPAIFAANFLVMALGLALDRSGFANSEELLHRPFVLVYFVTAAWTGGAAVRLLSLPGSARRLSQVAGSLALAALLLVPLATDRRVQAMERMGVSYVRVPTAHIEACRWLRANALPGSVFQDSRFDGFFFLESGLSDLRSYVSFGVAATNPSAETRRRMAAVVELRKARSAATLRAMAEELGIDWFVLQPGDPVWWPTEALDRPAFESGGLRVYRLR